ncbi:hypothetical protein TSUD_161750 [Trifolium subterraneum]|uniref:Uncharacterized protein n=1 Tax=Trifolium subterraneum TaxID=3900 RepID=A0A2Z6N156_TRISU|nr:hypothetical protein TSUD_161750 [Trifolium subterraneum]
MFAEPEYNTQHAAADRLRIISSYAEPPQITGFKVLKLDTSKDPVEWQNASTMNAFKTMCVHINCLKHCSINGNL